ncbi:MAG: 2-dehydropantoate 2-reductase [Betaproteobacteria bacterium]
MKIAVMGAGGVGGYFGGKLALSGEEVHFIARGAHLTAIRTAGLRVYSANGDVTLQPATATDDPASIGPVDIVMIAVKLWSTDDALRDAKPLVGPNTAVVSFQNGVVATDAIIKAYGREHAWGGVASIAAVIESPGVIRHTGTMALLTIGELDGKVSERLQRFVDACGKAGVQAKATDDIQKALWEKFVFLAAASGMTALTRLPLGAIREEPETRALTAQVMSEVAAIGKAKGVHLDADLVEKLMQRLDTMPREMVASMLGDLERGGRLELPWLSGDVVTMGQELGIAAPANAFICAALRPYANGRPADARTPKA